MFNFKFSFGGFPGETLEYTVKKENDSYKFIALGRNASRVDLTTNVSESVAQELMAIVDKYNLVSWDGFDKNAEGIFDGESFTLEVSYQDVSITAHGHMVFPENYGQIKAELKALFGNLVKEHIM